LIPTSSRKAAFVGNRVGVFVGNRVGNRETFSAIHTKFQAQKSPIFLRKSDFFGLGGEI
jgi:hypothetical protein